MKFFTGTLVTSNIDRHGEVVHPDLIHELAKQSEKYVRPMLDSHDWRKYLGRNFNPRVVNTDGNQVALVADIEVFEQDDKIPQRDVSKRLVPIQDVDFECVLRWDPNHMDPCENSILDDLKRIFPVSKDGLRYKELTLSLSAIVIFLGGLAIGNIAGGFFKAIGADGYASLKKTLTKPRGLSGNCRVMQFHIVVQDSSHACEVRVYVHLDAVLDDEKRFDSLWDELRNQIVSMKLPQNHIRHAIFEFDESGIRLVQRVRDDGVPLELSNLVPLDPNKMGLSSGSII